MFSSHQLEEPSLIAFRARKSDFILNFLGEASVRSQYIC